MEWWGARGAANGGRDVLFSGANCSEKSWAFVQGGPCYSPSALTCTHFSGVYTLNHTHARTHSLKETRMLSVEILECETHAKDVGVRVHTHTCTHTCTNTHTHTLSQPSDLSRSAFSLWHLQTDRAETELLDRATKTPLFYCFTVCSRSLSYLSMNEWNGIHTNDSPNLFGCLRNCDITFENVENCLVSELCKVTKRNTKYK